MQILTFLNELSAGCLALKILHPHILQVSLFISLNLRGKQNHDQLNIIRIKKEKKNLFIFDE
jgi:hypothetical protein